MDSCRMNPGLEVRKEADIRRQTEFPSVEHIDLLGSELVAVAEPQALAPQAAEALAPEPVARSQHQVWPVQPAWVLGPEAVEMVWGLRVAVLAVRWEGVFPYNYSC